MSFLFDLDGTLVDSVYQHVLAWREALESGGIHLAVWRIHRQIGMSGGLSVKARWIHRLRKGQDGSMLFGLLRTAHYKATV